MTENIADRGVIDIYPKFFYLKSPTHRRYPAEIYLEYLFADNKNLWPIRYNYKDRHSRTLFNEKDYFLRKHFKILEKKSKNHRGTVLIEKRPQVECSSIPKYPPEWLGDIFGPTKTKFSAEKAKKILGWRPLILLGEGQEITTAWLKSVRLL